ncbi:TonB family protein [Myxococcota bacterium]|nr:TonB family protein [Myxococcota bacterium]
MLCWKHHLAAFLIACGLNGMLLWVMTWLHRPLDATPAVITKTVPPAFAKVRLSPPQEALPTTPTLENKGSSAPAPSLLPALALPSAIPLPHVSSLSQEEHDPLLHPSRRGESANGRGVGRSGQGVGGAKGTSLILTEAMIDRPVRILVRIPPNYPPHAETSNIEGEVQMRLLVGLAGEVERVEIVESRPTRVFDNAARIAAQQWRFEAARFRGTPVRVWVRQRLAFRLR